MPDFRLIHKTSTLKTGRQTLDDRRRTVPDAITPRGYPQLWKRATYFSVSRPVSDEDDLARRWTAGHACPANLLADLDGDLFEHRSLRVALPGQVAVGAAEAEAVECVEVDAEIVSWMPERVESSLSSHGQVMPKVERRLSRVFGPKASSPLSTRS